MTGEKIFFLLLLSVLPYILAAALVAALAVMLWVAIKKRRGW